MSTIVKNIHIFKNGAWHPISKVFHQGEWKKMRGIFYDGEWYEIGSTCVVMPPGCAIATNEHPRWNESEYYGTNNFGFNALPSGYKYNGYNVFNYIGEYAYWWSSTSKDSTTAYYMHVKTNESQGTPLASFKDSGYAVRVVKDYIGNLPDGTILENDYTDGSGNEYDAVVIGNQLWTTKNLCTLKYQNGENIEYVDGNWARNYGGCCWYNNDYNSYGKHYGALYNWHAVNNGLVDFNGYRVPTYREWVLVGHIVSTNWCDLEVTGSTVWQYLKSCRQVNHPLAT